MRRHSLVFFVLAAIGACGGSITTVDGNKNLSTLSPTDKNTLCQDSYNYARSAFSNTDRARFACGLVFDSTDPATCEANFNACVTKYAQEFSRTPPSQIDCTGFNEAIAKCNVTVADFTSCLQQELDIVKSLESRFPLCDKTAQQQAYADATARLTQQCAKLYAAGCTSPTLGGGLPN